MRGSSIVVIVVLIAMVGVIVSANESTQLLNDPGYRPPSEDNAEVVFRKNLGNTTITIFPTVVRTYKGIVYDKSSRAAIKDFLNKEKIAVASLSEEEMNLGKSDPENKTQWGVFQGSISIFGEHLKEKRIETKYAAVMEFLVTPRRSGGEAIGGIQCYILDSEGKNVFSFLLNSHHRLFTEAGLKTDMVSTEGQTELLRKGTEVVIEALRQQLGIIRGKR